MKEVGKVIESNDNIVKVKIVKHSACSKCDKSCPLSNTEQHEQEEMVFKVKNNIVAKKGDQVNIEIENKNLVISSLLMYLMPLINMVIGYFFGQWISIKFNILTPEINGIIGTMIFLLLSFFLLKYIDSKLVSSNKINPRIVKIHNKNKYYSNKY